MKSPQELAFKSAVERLAQKLKVGEAAFSTGYLELRRTAFEVEFLAKFYRKAPGHRTYERIIGLAKPLEDRLGAIDDAYAMVEFCKRHQIKMPSGVEAAEVFAREAKAEVQRCLTWAAHKGWRDGRALTELRELLRQPAWLDEKETLRYAQKHMALSLCRLQDQIKAGVYDPKHKKGYRLGEVEPRVHKLRREVRKQAQFLAYTDGLFKLANRPGRLTAKFSDLAGSPIARSPYSQLPASKVAKPLIVPRLGLLAINRFVEELGTAKDWAFRLERLNEVGLKGRIDFNQLDVTLSSWRGTPVPFNALVLGILKEIRLSRVFSEIAGAIEKSR